MPGDQLGEPGMDAREPGGRLEVCGNLDHAAVNRAHRAAGNTNHAEARVGDARVDAHNYHHAY